MRQPKQAIKPGLRELTYGELLASAKEQAAGYDENDVGFDDLPAISRGEDGAWVQAWIWVRYPDAPEPETSTCGATQGKEDDARALCLKAGRDPDEVITKYVMEDLAAVLIDGADIEPERIVAILRQADTKTLGEAVSTGWAQVFQDYADEIEDPAPCS